MARVGKPDYPRIASPITVQRQKQPQWVTSEESDQSLAPKERRAVVVGEDEDGYHPGFHRAGWWGEGEWRKPIPLVPTENKTIKLWSLFLSPTQMGVATTLGFFYQHRSCPEVYLESSPPPQCKGLWEIWKEEDENEEKEPQLYWEVLIAATWHQRVGSFAPFLPCPGPPTPLKHHPNSYLAANSAYLHAGSYWDTGGCLPPAAIAAAVSAAAALFFCSVELQLLVLEWWSGCSTHARVHTHTHISDQRSKSIWISSLK